MVDILIAEDDKDDFLLLQEALENILPDSRISHSRNGRQLLQVVGETIAPDLIFLDLNMPMMSGIDCLVALRQRKELAATPVIIYSTSSDFEDIDVCYKNGCTLYLVKPPSFKELLAELKRILLHGSAQQALAKAEEKFSLYLKASSEQVFKMSADWQKMYVLAGKSFLSEAGDSAITWLQKNIFEEDRVLVTEAFQYAIATKSIFELEHRIIKEDGTIGWSFSRAVPVMNEEGNILEWFGTASDITARKAAEQSLRDEHYFLEQITNNTPHLIYVYDLQEQYFIYINRRIQELTGIMQDDVYSMGPLLFKMILHPDDVDSRVDYLQHLSTLLAGDMRQNEFRIRVAGGYRWFRSKDHIFKTANGKVKQVIGLAEEITYEKRLEEVLVSQTGGIGLN